MGKVWKVLLVFIAILFWLAVLMYIAPRSVQLPKKGSWPPGWYPNG